ncbi:hypothetical protein AX15_000690 [Amanita polypyramis BW_CC]|nr:hypothetical protein AX15_000690 [Amanita polypyramis BW_CC]
MGLLSLLPCALASLFTSPTLSEHACPPPLLEMHSPLVFMPEVPLEILMTILELLYYDNNLEVDIAILKSCSLVCRSWSTPAQKLVFHRVTLQNQKALESFVDAIDRSTERGCILGDAVKCLRIVMDHNQPLGIHQHSSALSVSLCPNLTGLSLSLYGCAAPGKDIVGAPDQLRMRRPAPLFDEQTIQLFTSGPEITSLEFHNWSENGQATTQLLQVWPTLKSLSISGTAPQFVATPSPLPCALEHVRLNFQTPPSDDYMKWLLHNSSESLRVLEFDREPSVHLLDYLLTSCGSTLCSLSLPSLSFPEQASIIQKCSQLRELRTESPSVLPVLYRKLPESLEHMAFGMDKDSALHAILRAVKNRTSLKTITAHIWSGGESHSHISNLKVKCAWRGVDLRVTDNIRQFRLMMASLPLRFL